MEKNPQPQKVPPPRGVIVREPHLQEQSFPPEKPFRVPAEKKSDAPNPKDKPAD
jgi:hypothetical protein